MGEGGVCFFLKQFLLPSFGQLSIRWIPSSCRMSLIISGATYGVGSAYPSGVHVFVVVPSFKPHKSAHFMQCSTKTTYCFLILNVGMTCEYLNCCKINLFFYKVQISINFKKFILNSFVLSVALAWNGNYLVLHKGDNSYSNNLKGV
jgi:hypothetical protein